MKISSRLTRAFYAVAGRDAEYVLANTDAVVLRGITRGQVSFDWKHGSRTPLIALPSGHGDITIFHELAHAYHIHHWPVVSHFCAVERCEEAAACLTWMAAYIGALDYREVAAHDRVLADPRQRQNMLMGQRAGSAWYNRTRHQRHVNAYVRNLLHADLR